MKRRELAIAAGTFVVATAMAGAAGFAWYRRANREVPLARKPAPPPSISGQSLYQLESTWTTDTDRVIHLRDLGGPVYVMALMFTQCSGTCPILVKELQAFEHSLPHAVLASLGFLLVSIDPENDTTAALRNYRSQMKLDHQHWTLLRGEAADVRELAAVLGFNYTPAEAQQFAHSNIITVLSSGGEIVHQQTGTGGDPGALMAILEAEAAP